MGWVFALALFAALLIAIVWRTYTSLARDGLPPAEPDLNSDIAAVRAGRAQRLCNPGKWIVSRDGGGVIVQHLGVIEMAKVPQPSPTPTPPPPPPPPGG